MDFLPRYFTSGALVGALCLVFSAPAFAIANTTGYSWEQSSDGSYHVIESSGTPASSDFDSGSSFVEGSSGGVIESVAPPFLTIDGASGNVTVGLARSLTVGDLVDGLTKCLSLDNPVGLTILAASVLGPLALQIYDEYHENQSSSSGAPTNACGSSVYWTALQISCLNGQEVGSSVGPFPSYASCNISSSSCTSAGGYYYQPYENYSNGSGPFASECPSSGVYTPAPSTVPTDLPNWIDTHYDEDDLAADTRKALVENPSDSPELATELADNDSPLSSPVPYTYTPTSNTLAESPSTTTSTDPSTGDSTSTTTTPSFDVSAAPDGGLQVTEDDSSVTSSCTSAGSCTVTNTSTDSTTPKTASPFVSPSTTIPTASTSSVKSFALSLVVPAQSVASCPNPLSFTALSNTFTIPLTPLCNLATDVNPYVESLGAVGAGIVIFR